MGTGRIANLAARRPAGARTLGVVVGVGLVGATLMPGCYGYRTVRQDPHIEVGAGGFVGVNNATVANMTVEAAAWVVNEFPVPPGVTGGSAVMNLPEGTRYDRAIDIVRRIDTRTGSGVYRVTRERLASGLPVYHVGRVWHRGGRAKVDVIRPVFELGADDAGRWATQAVTVELEGGLGTWRVVRHRAWAVDSVTVPAPNTWIEDHGMTDPEENAEPGGDAGAEPSAQD